MAAQPRARARWLVYWDVRAGRLFQAIVVLGAEFGAGCGGNSVGTAGSSGHADVPPVVGGGDGAVAGRADAFWPEACEHESQYRCTSYAPLEGCVCDKTAPADAQSCGGEPKFQCTHSVCNPATPAANCPALPNVDCRCLPDAPVSPADCPAGPGQFECDAYDPVLRSCRCNPSRPGRPEDCTPTDAFQCQAYAPTYYACQCNLTLQSETACMAQTFCSYSCVSQTPRFGCECQCVTPIR